MIELNKVGELYYLAHKLANNCPDKYVSWFAVVNYFILFLNLKIFQVKKFKNLLIINILGLLLLLREKI